MIIFFGNSVELTPEMPESSQDFLSRSFWFHRFAEKKKSHWLSVYCCREAVILLLGMVVQNAKDVLLNGPGVLIKIQKSHACPSHSSVIMPCHIAG